MPIWLYFVFAFVILDIVLVLWIYFRRSRSAKLRNPELKYLHSHWQRLNASLDNDPRGAVLDADKLLDYALKAWGFRGSLGEKLKQASAHFSDLNGIWAAHKLRNKIAHEMMDLKVPDAKLALKQFRRALNDLGAGL